MFGDLFRSGGGRLDALLVRAIDDPAVGTVAVVSTLLAAVAVGAVHAFGLGHGKTLLGGWLAGSEGRTRDAVALGVLVALMHTGSVLVLGSALHATRQVPGGDRLEPILMLLSALTVTSVGGMLLVRHLRARDTEPETVAVTHHHHALGGVAPVSRAGAVALASTGGLLPSPAALLVLMTALALGAGDLRTRVDRSLQSRSGDHPRHDRVDDRLGARAPAPGCRCVGASQRARPHRAESRVRGWWCSVGWCSPPEP